MCVSTLDLYHRQQRTAPPTAHVLGLHPRFPSRFHHAVPRRVFSADSTAPPPYLIFTHCLLHVHARPAEQAHARPLPPPLRRCAVDRYTRNTASYINVSNFDVQCSVLPPPPLLGVLSSYPKSEMYVLVSLLPLPPPTLRLI